MKFRYWNLALIFGFISAVSPAVFACSADVYVCNSAETNTEASCLLSHMKDQALQVRQVSDNLIGLDHEGWGNFWQYDASTLQRAKTHVNEMDQTLYQLRAIQQSCSSAERRAIRLLGPSVIELSDTTQAAIHYLNQHHLALMLPAYQNDAQVMYNKANRVVNFVDDYQDYVLERARARQLKYDLGIAS